VPEHAADSGANTLLGDGHVEWRGRERFPSALLQAGTPDGAYVITANDDRVQSHEG